MFPTSPVNYTPNCCNMDLKASRDICQSFRSCSPSYLSNLILIKYRIFVLRAWEGFISSFCHHVISILFMVAKEKMRKTYTWRIVTLVQNANVSGSSPVCISHATLLTLLILPSMLICP